MNTKSVIIIARKHVGNAGRMEALARAKLAEAVVACDAGDFLEARTLALVSLSHSVGFSHIDYKRAYRSLYLQQPLESAARFGGTPALPIQVDGFQPKTSKELEFVLDSKLVSVHDDLNLTLIWEMIGFAPAVKELYETLSGVLNHFANIAVSERGPNSNIQMERQALDSGPGRLEKLRIVQTAPTSLVRIDANQAGVLRMVLTEAVRFARARNLQVGTSDLGLGNHPSRLGNQVDYAAPVELALKRWI